MNGKRNLNISRRDFLNGVLLGTGAALLTARAPLSWAAANSIGRPDNAWTGPGGLGDYSMANGDTATVTSMAHSVRDGEIPRNSSDTNEHYDLVVVGSGFAGLGAAYTFNKERKGKARILVLDVHPVPGGVAKLNEFNVDGHRLFAPQGSDSFAKPNAFAHDNHLVNDVWTELGLPASGDEFNRVIRHQKPKGVNSSIKFSPSHYSSKYLTPWDATQGHFFRTGPNGSYQMYKNIVQEGFKNSPYSPRVQSQLQQAFNMDSPMPYKGDDWMQYMDRRLYKDWLEKDLGYDPEVTRYLSPILAAAGGGLGANGVSTFHAYRHAMPGTTQYYRKERGLNWASELWTKLQFYFSFESIAFPGGNSLIARHLFKKLVPKGIAGNDNINDILNKRFVPEEFDRPDRNVRFRLSSMVSSVKHDGNPNTSSRVLVSYVKNGTMFRVSADKVVLGVGAWIAKKILADAPPELRQAMGSYSHAPMLTTNLAVRNWRFFEKKGISAASYKDGFGSFVNIRTPMQIGDYTEPFNPDMPIVLTNYMSFEQPDMNLPPSDQTRIARHQMLSMSYAEIERKLLKQYMELFSDSGFDPQKDVAGLIVNRLGHDFVAAPPGFYFGLNGGPAAPDIIRKGYGRISIGHSELNGVQTWFGAYEEGHRAATQALG